MEPNVGRNYFKVGWYLKITKKCHKISCLLTASLSHNCESYLTRFIERNCVNYIFLFSLAWKIPYFLQPLRVLSISIIIFTFSLILLNLKCNEGRILLQCPWFTSELPHHVIERESRLDANEKKVCAANSFSLYHIPQENKTQKPPL